MRSAGRRGGAIAMLALVGSSVIGGAASGQTILAESYFDASVDGWSVTSSSSYTGFAAVASFAATWVASGGNPGGFARLTEPDGNISFWTAPSAYLGDESDAYGGVLSFDLQQSATDAQFSAPDVVMQGTGLTLVLDLPYNPETRWSRYHVLLTEGGGWRVGALSGAPATDEQVMQVLSELTGLYLRAEYRYNLDTDGIDNVVIRTADAAWPSSVFDANMDGWWVLNDAHPPTWLATGGNPGGFIQAVDIGDGRYWCFLAPAKYLGNRQFIVGGTLEYDLRVSANESQSGGPACIVYGGGLQLSFAGIAVPVANSWSHFRIPLFPSAGWTVFPGGGTPTLADFATALGSVTQLQIRAEFSDTFDTDGLDNVRLAHRGDLNCDGVVDFDDVNPFVDALMGQAVYEALHTNCNWLNADCNCDGAADFTDIGAFVDCLSGDCNCP